MNSLSDTFSCLFLQKMTPLHYAADTGNVSVIKLLISHGADINALDEDEQTPFAIAEICDHKVYHCTACKHGNGTSFTNNVTSIIGCNGIIGAMN